jgi:hypothetical protein
MSADYSKEHTASIFRAEGNAEHEKSRYRESDGQGSELIHFSILKIE